MTKTITFRPDEEAMHALSVLTHDGAPVSTVVRNALIEAARNRIKHELLEEATRLAADEDCCVEAAEVLRDMETLRAW